jgi:hypothetical protein
MINFLITLHAAGETVNSGAYLAIRIIFSIGFFVLFAFSVVAFIINVIDKPAIPEMLNARKFTFVLLAFLGISRNC